MDQTTSTFIAAAVPTLAVIAAFVRNEVALSGLTGQIARLDARITSLEARLDGRIETLTRDMNSRFETLTRRIEAVDAALREWARVTMRHNTDIARLKDKAGFKSEE